MMFENEDWCSSATNIVGHIIKFNIKKRRIIWFPDVWNRERDKNIDSRMLTVSDMFSYFYDWTELTLDPT